MTTQSRPASDAVRAATILRRTAFAVVFSGLLMPLGMTTATGQVLVEVHKNWESVVATRGVYDSGGSRGTVGIDGKSVRTPDVARTSR